MDHAGMDHGHMDHGHMDHGDMDMGQCSMNVRYKPLLFSHEPVLMIADDFYLVVQKPLYHLLAMANYWNVLSDHVPDRDRRLNSWI